MAAARVPTAGLAAAIAAALLTAAAPAPAAAVPALAPAGASDELRTGAAAVGAGRRAGVATRGRLADRPRAAIRADATRRRLWAAVARPAAGSRERATAVSERAVRAEQRAGERGEHHQFLAV